MTVCTSRALQPTEGIVDVGMKPITAKRSKLFSHNDQKKEYVRVRVGGCVCEYKECRHMCIMCTCKCVCMYV